VSVTIVLVTAITLIAVSFDTLEPNQIGLEYQGPSMSINKEKLYPNGRYFLGVGHKFIKYPKTLQSVKFNNDGDRTAPPISARTKDGLAITLAVAFNYRLRPTISEITSLYLSFGEMDQVTHVYNRIARNWVRVVSSEFTAFEFFFNRTTIQARMQEALDVELERAHGDVENLQLLDIDLPARFEEARVRQETAVQEIANSENDRDVARIDSQTEVNRATEEAKVIVLQASARARAVELETEANLEALQARFEAEAQAYGALGSALELTSNELLSYMWLESLASTNADNTILHMKKPSALH
jgi:regulator of protease activity HflC (stomatin/prohibitin superfamily)